MEDKIEYEHRTIYEAIFALSYLALIGVKKIDVSLIDNLKADCDKELALYEDLKQRYAKAFEILEIIKNKKVNIPYLWSMIEDFENTFNSKVENVLWLYNEGLESKYHLTETEFNLIKEWLTNE